LENLSWQPPIQQIIYAFYFPNSGKTFHICDFSIKKVFDKCFRNNNALIPMEFVSHGGNPAFSHALSIGITHGFTLLANPARMRASLRVCSICHCEGALQHFLEPLTGAIT
jgi:hypothetical protein